jgi:acyl carrier protein
MRARQGLTYNDVSALVIGILREVLGSKSRAIELSQDTPLIGQNSVLDSLGLVTLIVDLEQRMDEEFGICVTLADDRAMSQRNSPFRSVASLTDYILMLTQERA